MTDKYTEGLSESLPLSLWRLRVRTLEVGLLTELSQVLVL